MKILESYKKIAKSMLTEYAWDRKFGEPLPTLEDVMKEADDDDAYVHVGGGRYKEKNRATGEPLPNSPSYIKKDSGGFEMVDDDDPRLSKGDDDKGDDKEEPKGKGLGKGDFERGGGEPEDKPFGGDTGKDADSGYVSKNKPQKAKDLANDPSADTGPDSRGTEWSGDYYGADDSAEWQDDYEEAEEDGDDEKLAQIKWFGEKQGWGDDGELGGEKDETIKVINGRKYRAIKESVEPTVFDPIKQPMKEMYRRIGGK